MMILTEASDRFVPMPIMELLSPLIRDILQAAGVAALEQAAQAAVSALGFHYFVFVTGLARAADEPFRPVLASLPKPIRDALWENALYRSNPVLDHIRSTGIGMVIDFAALPAGPTVDKARALLAPAAITGAAVVPVISATEHLTVLAVYRRGADAPSQAVLEPLAVVGTAISMRMLTLFGREAQSPLTDAQREILKWAAAGKSAGDIAIIMGLSRRGCEYHLGEIYRKLGVASRSQAVAAYARGVA